MGVQRACLVHLAAAQHHRAIGLLRVHVHEHVRVLLLARAHRAVAFGVRHRAAQHQILALAHGDEVTEALVVFRAVLLINVIGRAPDRIRSVHANAPLEARSCTTPQLPLHETLLHEILRRLGDVQEAAHTVAGEADCGAQLGVVAPQAVGLGDAVHGGPDQGMVHEVLHRLPEDDDAHVAVAQGGEVILRRPDLRELHVLRPRLRHRGRHRHHLQAAAAALAATPARPRRPRARRRRRGVRPRPLRQVLDVDLLLRRPHVLRQSADARGRHPGAQRVEDRNLTAKCAPAQHAARLAETP
mmetsp:Transcript_68078/g.190673  ORF Transcript_68078/g.190673 Transcript_68078/m.190673 type:complete len:300 (+) Transcript_68078:1258-2157(+)